MLEITELPEGFSETALAIGKFDGVHLGHQQLIHELVTQAEEHALAPVVVTFDRHPNHVLNPDNVPLPIIGPRQKVRLVAELGVAAMRTLIFDEVFAHLTPEEFVVTHIVPLQAKLVLVGEGFRFGHKGSGSVETLSELGAGYGFKAQQVSHVMLDDQKISSTKTRQLIAEGKVFAASVLLGRNHQTEGVVEHGRKLGRKLGYPTANLSRDSEGLLPADGVYAGYLYADGVRYEAAHSVGTNDSIEAVPRLLESHVIGRDDLDLYGKTVICEYVDQVRPWAKFESVDELTDQIARDVAGATKILEG
ncbi:MAG: riboflavin biosynthesis protein RibF [Aquiluna sp.]